MTSADAEATSRATHEASDAPSYQDAARRALLSWVGDRSQEEPLTFALRAVRRIGVSISDFADVETLRARAIAAGAPTADATPGDLILFRGDRVVGVVTSVREDGTIEFVYARRVIRRGYVNPGRPRDRRDERGRALNTFVLPAPPATSAAEPSLAGELFEAIVSVRRL